MSSNELISYRGGMKRPVSRESASRGRTRPSQEPPMTGRAERPDSKKGVLSGNKKPLEEKLKHYLKGKDIRTEYSAYDRKSPARGSDAGRKPTVMTAVKHSPGPSTTTPMSKTTIHKRTGTGLDSRDRSGERDLSNRSSKIAQPEARTSRSNNLAIDLNRIRNKEVVNTPTSGRGRPSTTMNSDRGKLELSGMKTRMMGNLPPQGYDGAFTDRSGRGQDYGPLYSRPPMNENPRVATPVQPRPALESADLSRDKENRRKNDIRPPGKLVVEENFKYGAKPQTPVVEGLRLSVHDENRPNGRASPLVSARVEKAADQGRVLTQVDSRKKIVSGERSGSLTDRQRGRPEPKNHRELSVRPQNRDGSMSDRGHHRAHSDILGQSSKKLPKFEETKIVLKNFGKICGFGVNTHKGCVRNYNEDRVSILLNAQQR